jgi:type IV pilus assembly protein PilA
LRNTTRKQNGFSLIELLIVVAIILLIAAIAIPNLLRARMSANEASAAGGVRTITTAETSYNSTYPAIGYAVQIQDMGSPSPCVPSPLSACLLDNSLANAVPGSSGHSGYQFLATGINFGTPANTDFVAGAKPISVNYTGDRDFCSTAEIALRSQPTTGGPPPNTIATCLTYPIVH